MIDTLVPAAVRGVFVGVGRWPARVLADVRAPRSRWGSRAAPIEQLLIIPPDLRSADPGFAAEIAEGQFGIAGHTVHLIAGSPFAVIPPDLAWEKELHGFGWLRHCAIGRTPDMVRFARSAVMGWIETRGHKSPTAWSDDVLPRRLLSWIAHAETILDGASRDEYDQFMRALADEASLVTRRLRTMPISYARLLAAIAKLQFHLVLPDREAEQKLAILRLTAELDRQLLADGGHVSRNPAVLVDLLLDLVPLRQSFVARRMPCPEVIEHAMRRIVPMLRHLRLGDGSIARFNGMGVTMPDAVATALAYDRHFPSLAPISPESGYGRIESCGTVCVMDVGTTPPSPFASAAHAGCLSFELSAGRYAVFVNAGLAEEKAGRFARIAPSRATASHTALVLGETSSATLSDRGTTKKVREARLSGKVQATHAGDDVGLALEGSHQGYAKRFGLGHRRRLTLSRDGERLEGIDTLEAISSSISEAVPCAIHFHVHIDVDLRMGWQTNSVLLTLPDLSVWRFSSADATLSIEESAHHALETGSRRTLQIVLRRLAGAGTTVHWQIERIGQADIAQTTRDAAQGVHRSLAEALSRVADR